MELSQLQREERGRQVNAVAAAWALTLDVHGLIPSHHSSLNGHMKSKFSQSLALQMGNLETSIDFPNISKLVSDTAKETCSKASITSRPRCLLEAPPNE